MTIKIDHIYKNYNLPSGQRLPALRNLTFEISAGDFVVVLGESGCGKSTLLNMIAGTEDVSEGEIRVDNNIIKGPDPSRSILFQQPALLPWLNIEENIVFGCKLRGDKKNSKHVYEWIQTMGLSGFEKMYPAELSLGMAQRVCLARAMIGHPEILLLDEPFSSLDTFTRTHLQKELIDFWQVENFTGIFVTHDIDEAILMGSRILMLGGRPGRIIDMFDIDLGYPRDISHPLFIKLRTYVLKKLRQTLVGFREKTSYASG
ncbi:ABC transporter ATP-binding protein [Desulfobacterales bacterium HSG17]|nr:ABC transporter ATP-binding protein [Desulfobacterales bacterium HSG17]